MICLNPPQRKALNEIGLFISRQFINVFPDVKRLEELLLSDGSLLHVVDDLLTDHFSNLGLNFDDLVSILHSKFAKVVPQIASLKASFLDINFQGHFEFDHEQVLLD